MSNYVILAAGGSGTRMHTDQNKVFLQVGSSSVLERSILLFNGLINGMVIVCRMEDRDQIESIIQRIHVDFPLKLTTGGTTRQESVLNGLRSLEARSDDYVLIHDAARCLTPVDVIVHVLESCVLYGSGVPAVPAVSTMKYADSDMNVVRTVPRTDLFEIQTPQGFRFYDLLQAYDYAEKDAFSATDDASVMEHAGLKVHLVSGSRQNIKLTEKEDLKIMNAFMNLKKQEYRVGMGYDVHRLVENRKLILCGVDIPHPYGLLGHSDADVGIHALMDALLGAASLGDIGKHFPDTSPEYKGISSLTLLEKVMNLIRHAGFELMNADITLVAQKPKIAPYIPEMAGNLSRVMACDPSKISIKATTTERLGFEGREEGISAQAVCMICRMG